MKRIIAVITMVVLLMLCIINAGAMPAPAYYGDANTDYTQDVLDVTFIQEVLADFKTMSTLQFELADVNDDNSVNIFDATMIQLKLAKSISEYPVGDHIYVYVQLHGIISDKESGTVVVYEPVTFTALPDGRCEPFYYDFYINGELVVDDSDSSSLTWTFDEPGDYSIKVRVTNSMGISTSGVIDFTVVE